MRGGLFRQCGECLDVMSEDPGRGCLVGWEPVTHSVAAVAVTVTVSGVETEVEAGCGDLLIVR